MATGSVDGKTSLQETSTWAVAAVCFVLIVTSLTIEHLIEYLAKTLRKHDKHALCRALETVKLELLTMGFLSLLLAIAYRIIADICVPRSVSDSWRPCKVEHIIEVPSHDRHLQDQEASANSRQIASKCWAQNKVPLLSPNGIHQLQIFIVCLAIFHVLYCVATLVLGKLKMKTWTSWEKEAKTTEYQILHDPNRFRLSRDSSFIRWHSRFSSSSTILIWIVCFFRQFVGSVAKVDYLMLRHGFIMAHLAPKTSTRFDFRRYIKRSLEEDFKIVVGISPALRMVAVLLLLCNTHGKKYHCWYSFLWLPFVPLVILLLVGTKLQVVMERMALQILSHGDVVIKGDPIVRPTDELFWFKHPSLTRHLIHFVLFQNAFQLAFLSWSWFEFGYPSCFHKRIEDLIIRISMGILIQVLCSYVTLPLYALVTQMGSSLKPAIFTERVEAALRVWHQSTRKRLHKKQQHEVLTLVSPTRATSPKPSISPLQHLQNQQSYTENFLSRLEISNVVMDTYSIESTSLPPCGNSTDSFSYQHEVSIVGTEGAEKRTQQSSCDLLRSDQKI